MKITALVLATILSLLVQTSVAQVTGGLSGAITDQSGAPVPGAQVSITSGNGTVKAATSGNDGAYAVNGLSPGKYTVRASAPGLAQAEPATVEIGSATATLNIALRVALEKQEVTVEATAAPQVTVDPSQSASSLVISDKTLDALSDDPDDLQADLLALAGPAAGPNGGQLFIDGLTNGDSALPSKDSIREVRVNQNPFSPEYDAIGFGRVEILTKPGANKWHGQAYFNYGNGALNSRNPYAQDKAPFDLKEFGGSVSGALTSKASTFFSIDKRIIENGTVVNAVSLDPSTLAIINPFTQVFSSPVTRFRVSPRIDYQLNNNNTLMFRYALTRTGNTDTGAGGFNLPSTAYNTLNVEHAFQATETAVIGTKVIDETRFQFLHQHNTQNSNDTDPSIQVSNAFTGGGASNPLYYYIHHHYEVQNNLSILKGTHSWKMGVRLRAVSVQDSTHSNFDGTYTFGGAYAPILDSNFQPVVPGVVCNPQVQNSGCETISSIEQYQRTLRFQQMGMPASEIRLLGGGATQFSINAGDPLVDFGRVDVGLYAGDDWRVKPNLTFSYGLRWEGQTNIHDRSDFAPRLAFAWGPGGSKGSTPKTVFRGGAGIFYDRFNEQDTKTAQRFNGTTQQQYVIVNPDTFPAIPSFDQLRQFAVTQAINTQSSSLRAPYVIQGALGIERQLPGSTTLAATYTTSHGLHQFLSRNINAPLPGTYTGVPGTGVYPYPDQGPIYEMESGGLYNQNQLVVNVNSRVNAKISLFGFYTLSKAMSNTDGLGTFPANQYSLAGEYGPAGNDVRNRMSMGGSIATFWNLRLSPLITLQTGRPFDIITSQDVYGDTVMTARPGIATDPNQPGVVATAYGLLDPNPLPGEPLLPRNFGRGPGMYSVDLRLAKTFGLGRRPGSRSRAKVNASGGAAAPAAPTAGPPRRGGIGGFDNSSPAPSGGGSTGEKYNLTLSISARNLFNHTNPGPIIGNINSPLFGESNQIAGGFGAFSGSSSNRRLEFQARFSF